MQGLMVWVAATTDYLGSNDEPKNYGVGWLLTVFSVQSLSHVWLFVTPMDCSMPDFPVLELTQTHVYRAGDAIQPSHLPFFSCLQSFPASGSFPRSQFFASGGQSIGASASASVLPMNSQDWSFRIDWLDFLTIQGTLKSLLQHHSSKASILWCSAFFIVQLSHPYMTTGKSIALTRRTSVGFLICCLGWSYLFFQGAGVF